MIKLEGQKVTTLGDLKVGHLFEFPKSSNIHLKTDYVSEDDGCIYYVNILSGELGAYKHSSIEVKEVTATLKVD